MNRVTVFMFCLSSFMAVIGLCIIWLGVVTAEWPGVVIGLAWVAFTGSASVYAWIHRYEP